MRLLLILAVSLMTACAAPTERQSVSDNPAVLSLVESARTEAAAERFSAAAAGLERALRIEPRNPLIWQELARVRLAEGRFEQAVNLATRSNSFAQSNSLRVENWHIIGEAKSLGGDTAGAQEAYRRAAELR